VSRRPALAAAGVSAALCVPTAAAVPVLVLHERDAVGEQQAREDAAAAARRAAEDVLSYDYRTVGDDIARARSEATGLFSRQYAASADQLAEQARATRAIVQARAGDPAIISATSTEAVVLVFVDQVSVKQLRGAASPTTRIDQSRVRLTMSRIGGRWLVSQLAAL
jgi:Mce-associated membrane protein